MSAREYLLQRLADLDVEARRSMGAPRERRYWEDIVDAAIVEGALRYSATEREALKPWLDHRWGCKISRQLRENRAPVTGPCDCGWNEKLVEWGWRK